MIKKRQGIYKSYLEIAGLKQNSNYGGDLKFYGKHFSFDNRNYCIISTLP